MCLSFVVVVVVVVVVAAVAVVVVIDRCPAVHAHEGWLGMSFVSFSFNYG